jgi:hypothetical protein
MEARVRAHLNVRQNALILSFVALAGTASAQAPQSAPAQPAKASSMTLDEVRTLATVEIAIGKIRDSLDLQLALARNKKDEMQMQLRQKMKTDVAAALQKHGMSDADYRKKTFLVSTDGAARKLFDSLVVAISGVPLPGQFVAAPSAPTVAVPAGPVGIHLGHVVNSFSTTPNMGGLLTTALGEARVALQHAQLASRQPTNLEYMKTHSLHVLNALDPSLEKTGPGLGYGLRRAAEGVAEHITLAAAAENATPAHKLHAGHVAIGAKNTVTRVDAMIALARQVSGATDAAAAAQLVAQLAGLAEQLIAGADANADGRITVDVNEAGLQLADDHVKLMLGGQVK